MNEFAYLDFSYRAVWRIVKLRILCLAFAVACRDANLRKVGVSDEKSKRIKKIDSSWFGVSIKQRVTTGIATNQTGKLK